MFFRFSSSSPSRYYYRTIFFTNETHFTEIAGSSAKWRKRRIGGKEGTGLIALTCKIESVQR